jgi:uncharacterized membrane protein
MSVGKTADYLKKYFVSGVLVVVPLILTYIVLRFLFDAIDGILRPGIEKVFGYYFWGLGVLTTILLIFLAGILTRNYVGHRIYGIGDRLLHRMPIIRPVYSSAKQLLTAITATSGASFKEVCLVEYPRKGVYALGFIAQRTQIEVGGELRDHAVVFIASTPTPVSGMITVVPIDEVFFINMTVEEGVKFLVSGGVASPAVLRNRPGGGQPATSEVTT